uniref:Uncharacterized protein n=1 Tax=Catharus ustulatus TaxID=91951 RepID=A0A8C3XXL7_CATUS
GEDPVRERKLFLQEELRTVTQLLDTYLDRAQQLLQANKRLEKEAQDTQEQSQSYLSCGAKLSRDPPGMVITLSQQNCRDLAQIQAQQEQLVPQYAGKEQEVRSALQDTEAEASLLDTELEQLEPCKEQKVQAEQKVKALERELRLTRIRCAEETHGIRTPSAPPAAPDPAPSLPWTGSSPSRSFMRGCSEQTKREEQFSITSLKVEVWKIKLSFAFKKSSRNCFILGNEATCRKGVKELERIHQASKNQF